MRFIKSTTIKLAHSSRLVYITDLIFNKKTRLPVIYIIFFFISIFVFSSSVFLFTFMAVTIHSVALIDSRPILINNHKNNKNIFTDKSISTIFLIFIMFLVMHSLFAVFIPLVLFIELIQAIISGLLAVLGYTPMSPETTFAGYRTIVSHPALSTPASKLIPIVIYIFIYPLALRTTWLACIGSIKFKTSAILLFSSLAILHLINAISTNLHGINFLPSEIFPAFNIEAKYYPFYAFILLGLLIMVACIKYVGKKSLQIILFLLVFNYFVMQTLKINLFMDFIANPLTHYFYKITLVKAQDSSMIMFGISLVVITYILLSKSIRDTYTHQNWREKHYRPPDDRHQGDN